MTISRKQFKDFYHTPYATARVSESEEGGYVSNVMTNVDYRGQGHGTALMGEITSHADEIGKPLLLHARPDLHPWYGKLGFEVAHEDKRSHPKLPLLVRQPKRITPSG